MRRYYRPLREQHNTHAVISHFNLAPFQLRPLRRIFVENRVGVVDVDKHLALFRQLLQHFEHAAGAVLCQVAHLTAGAGTDPTALHFVVIP